MSATSTWTPDVYLINLSSYFISIDSSVRGELLKPVVLPSLEMSALQGAQYSVTYESGLYLTVNST